jgi:succinate-acetate transporter protein
MEKHPNFIANGITLSPRGNRGYEICNISKWYMAIGSYEIPHCNCNSTDETMTGNVVVSYSLHVEIFVVIDFFVTIRLIQKIVQVQFILFAICFTIVCILILTYPFTCFQ